MFENKSKTRFETNAECEPVRDDVLVPGDPGHHEDGGAGGVGGGPGLRHSLPGPRWQKH